MDKQKKRVNIPTEQGINLQNSVIGTVKNTLKDHATNHDADKPATSPNQTETQNEPLGTQAIRILYGLFATEIEKRQVQVAKVTAEEQKQTVSIKGKTENDAQPYPRVAKVINQINKVILAPKAALDQTNQNSSELLALAKKIRPNKDELLGYKGIQDDLGVQITDAITTKIMGQFYTKYDHKTFSQQWTEALKAFIEMEQETSLHPNAIQRLAQALLPLTVVQFTIQRPFFIDPHNKDMLQIPRDELERFYTENPDLQPGEQLETRIRIPIDSVEEDSTIRLLSFLTGSRPEKIKELLTYFKSIAQKHNSYANMIFFPIGLISA